MLREEFFNSPLWNWGWVLFIFFVPSGQNISGEPYTNQNSYSAAIEGFLAFQETHNTIHTQFLKLTVQYIQDIPSLIWVLNIPSYVHSLFWQT